MKNVSEIVVFVIGLVFMIGSLALPVLAFIALCKYLGWF